MKIEVACPVCSEKIALTLTIRPRLTHNENGRKGFMTADVGASGIEHTCPLPTAENPDSLAALLREVLDEVLPLCQTTGKGWESVRRAKAVLDNAE